MSVMGLTDVSKPSSTETVVSLNSLAELTGFPVDFIKRELVLDGESNLSIEDLRSKVLDYLETMF